MKKLFSVFLALSLVVCLSVTAYAGDGKTLRFNEQGKFTILQISDPQDDSYPSHDMLNLISLAIEQTDPDLVVFSGDIVEDTRIADAGTDDEDWREGVCVYDNKGNILHDETLENVRSACDAIFFENESKGIPFAVAIGNNDYKTGLTSTEWLVILDGYDMSLTFDESGDEGGRVDFCLDVLSSETDDTAFALWLMDTGTGGITSSQLDWFTSKSDGLKAENGGESMPSMLFQHIPVDDIGNLFERCHIWDPGAKAKGLFFYRLNKNIANGYYTSVKKPGTTTPEFKAWKNGGVIAAFFGHLHTEGYSGTWDGIELGLTYGSQFAKNAPYGIRVITLDEDDPGNYINEQYVYEGSVKNGNAELVKQIDEPYPVYNGFFETLFANIRNTFVNIAEIIAGWFNF